MKKKSPGICPNWVALPSLADTDHMVPLGFEPKGSAEGMATPKPVEFVRQMG
jgi:hypothetical protein